MPEVIPVMVVVGLVAVVIVIEEPTGLLSIVHRPDP